MSRLILGNANLNPSTDLKELFQTPFPRASGVLLHISSLPSEHGIGDLGPEAYHFADLLSEAGQSYWQMLPVGPTGSGNSPYNALSAFAGNPLLISLELLLQDGLIEKSDLELPNELLTYPEIKNFKEKILRKASGQFQKGAAPTLWDEFRTFLVEEVFWIDDYAWFCALKERFNDAPWTDWPDSFRARRFRDWERKILHYLGEASFHHQFTQFIFHRQWQKLSAYCRKKGVSLIGDISIFVAHDSADVWAHPEIFDLNDNGMPIAVSGVPPDYFSETGQLWGNPLYRWDHLKDSNYEWWLRRLEISAKRFNAARLDHFIGFCRYWHIPAGAKTAAEGQWVAGPQEHFFSTLLPNLKGFHLIAEDLGVAGDDVYRLRDRFNFPGMNVLQFSYGGEEKFLPHNYAANSVAYTGTHDNDTLLGWLISGPKEETARARASIKNPSAEIHWDLIKIVMDSPANTAIIPAQDILGLGSDARMNRPGLSQGNWSWRLKLNQFNEVFAQRLKIITKSSNRLQLVE